MLACTPIAVNEPQVMDGLELLRRLDARSVSAAFFDPQYRALNDKMAYGDVNNPASKMAHVHRLPGMPVNLIRNMLIEIENVLLPHGHCFLWIDKLMLVEGVGSYLGLTDLKPVDMIVWDKQRIGMGYRSRRKSEYLVVLQKPYKGETRAKDCWRDRGIPDVWPETALRGGHPHVKPLDLITRLIEATTHPADRVVDPAAGSYRVLDACRKLHRVFVGCDLIDPRAYERLE